MIVLLKRTNSGPAKGIKQMPKKQGKPVGYGNPPVSGQFKPGQSGNPKGRPKGRKSLEKTIADAFNKKITVREGGQNKKISQMDALCRRVINDGLKGNAKATDQALAMLKIMAAAQSGASRQDDGTIPDSSADLKALQKFLELHDVSTDQADRGDAQDD